MANAVLRLHLSEVACYYAAPPPRPPLAAACSSTAVRSLACAALVSKRWLRDVIPRLVLLLSPPIPPATGRRAADALQRLMAAIRPMAALLFLGANGLVPALRMQVHKFCRLAAAAALLSAAESAACRICRLPVAQLHPAGPEERDRAAGIFEQLQR